MAHQYDQELLLGYVEEALDNAQVAQFEATLNDDARLRNLVAQLVGDRKILRAWPSATAPAYVLDGISEQLERSLLLGAGGGDPSPRTRRRRGRIVSVACVIGFFAISAGIVFFILNRSPQMWPTTESPDTVTASIATTDEYGSTHQGGHGDGNTRQARSPAQTEPQQGTTARDPARHGVRPADVAARAIPPRPPEEPDFIAMPGVRRLVTAVPVPPQMLQRTVRIRTDDAGIAIDRLHLWANEHGAPLRALPDDSLGAWEVVVPGNHLPRLVEVLRQPPTRQVHFGPPHRSKRPVVSGGAAAGLAPTHEPWRLTVKIFEPSRF